MARRVAIGNNKGGTKKSTLTVRLAEALAKKKKKVGVVETDPQGNASRRLGWKDSPHKMTTSEVIEANRVGFAAEAWQPIGWQTEYAHRISVIPARHTLEERAVEAGRRGAYRRLAKALDGTDDHLDYVLFDCQPSLGHLTEMALAAAHVAIGSTEPEYDSLEGLLRFRDFVDDSGEDLANPDLRFIGAVVSAHDQRLGAHTGQLANARRLFGDQIWGVIPRRSLITNADEYGKPLDDMADSGPIRAAFDLLAERFMKEVG